ncbi:MAG: CDP-alcohol phosphatidyltransferase family protein [Porticoccaceae bacterium]|jgi:CDP-diacylglycerol--glycerol-3-phosphate 3-phosphatidyltransferase|nr:CDP-alcohol phosphatidyltransferase family protein [Porticoccaceae bacterium]MBT3797981.1 CDP-alcohol phosphatidyltransferase family protein [Porticoccaceae bacterium]MBT4163442.1 CDP-alcohol phosphatidyltransferase family protein [Porticoccaceae bacterium]MBT4211010.1 CDP-alcohol phosphatidyltransferase family protein [Porticoccaceae bacterium]MBT4591239.1 CDP-alcohol phosphatidyltransferase family protein [Porticoccaceae bacterium]
MSTNLLSIANILSFLRLGLVPVLVWLAASGAGVLFLWVLGISLISDALDGYLARKLNQTSEFGAKLDSWGDALTYAVMILGLYGLWPDIFSEQSVFLLMATLSFLVPLVVASVKFGEYPSYHTLGAKIAALLIAPAYYLLIILDADIWFRLVILFYLLVAIEEILITYLLRHSKTNISSAWTLIKEQRNHSKSD